MAKGTIYQIAKTISSKGPCWTQGPGGNISEKKDDKLAIKASGFRLDEISEKQGLCQIEKQPFLEKLHALFNKEDTSENLEKSYALLIKKSSESKSNSLRASMESGFHALLPKKYVLHFHSCSALLMAHHAMHSKQKWGNFCKTVIDLDLTTIPFINPGLELCRRIHLTKESTVYLLANHGIIIQTDSPISLLDHWLKIELEFCNEFNYPVLGKLLSKPSWGRQDWTDLVDTPWKIYFPDTAVFANRIQKVTTGNELKSLVFNSWKIDKCASELWACTQLLYSTCPELNSIEEGTANSIAKLPTEQARLNLNTPGV